MSSVAMPMPVSITRHVTASRASSFATSSATRPPGSVNLTALLSRFSRICMSMRPSVCTMVLSSGSTVSTWMRRSMASWLTSRSVETAVSFTSTWETSGCSLPAPILDRSRMSLISDSRCCPLSCTSSSFSTCWSVSGPQMRSSVASVMPRIALSGVRSSWLMLARNSSFRRAARARSVLASVSSSVRSATTVSRCARSEANCSRAFTSSETSLIAPMFMVGRLSNPGSTMNTWRT